MVSGITYLRRQAVQELNKPVTFVVCFFVMNLLQRLTRWSLLLGCAFWYLHCFGALILRLVSSLASLLPNPTLWRLVKCSRWILQQFSMFIMLPSNSILVSRSYWNCEVNLCIYWKLVIFRSGSGKWCVIVQVYTESSHCQGRQK